MENLNFIISKRLTILRKKNQLTQLEVAEKLNYSDKAVSKWEQGESLPGIEVLCKLSELYGVSLDYIVGKKDDEQPLKVKNSKVRRYRIITLLSILAVWLVAVVCYVAFDLSLTEKFWMIFCWAVPASFIVALVFDCIWRKGKHLLMLISFLIWSVLLCFCLQFAIYNIWMLLLVGVPLQVGAVLWELLAREVKKNGENRE